MPHNLNSLKFLSPFVAFLATARLAWAVTYCSKCSDCNGASEIVIRASDGVIEPGAFSDCKSLTKVTFEDDNIESFGDYVFSGCTSLTEVTLPTFRAYYPYYYSFPYSHEIRPQGTGMFSGCSSLKTINNIPTHIPDSFCSGCTSLESIDVSGADFIGSYAFYYCTSLESIGPSGVYYIDQYAFSSCTSLNSVDLSGVRGCSGCQYAINDNAFSGCYNLSNVTIDPKSQISPIAFSGFGSQKATHISTTVVCPAGRFNSVAYETVTNRYGSVDSTTVTEECLPCSAGTYSPVRTNTCLECPGGTYSGAMAGECKICPAGHYCPPGASTFTICPAGSFAAVGAAHCSPCQAGNYSFPGSAECISCVGSNN